MFASFRRRLEELRQLFAFPSFFKEEEPEIYRLECPEGHISIVAREELNMLKHSPIDGTKYSIDHGILPVDTALPMSYLDCPHPRCREEATRHAYLYD